MDLQAAVEQYLDEAGQGDAAMGRARRLLALPFVGSGAGGAAAKQGGLLDELLSVLADSVVNAGFDVALVLRKSDAFAAAQSFRRREPDRYWPTSRSQIDATRGQLARAAAHGRLVVFIGAGVGTGAGLPTWEGLLEKSSKTAGLHGEEKLHSLDLAQLIEHRLDERPGGLRTEIAATFKVERYALGHALLANLPSDEAVTTTTTRCLSPRAAMLAANSRCSHTKTSARRADGC